ncbi:MAG: hypothetical protein RIF46_10835 [Cyclobacteriaceae bacterium]
MNVWYVMPAWIKNKMQPIRIMNLSVMVSDPWWWCILRNMNAVIRVKNVEVKVYISRLK